MSEYELARARELLAGTRLVCKQRTLERDDARALLERQAYPVELGRAVDGLVEQVLRLRRRDDLPFDLDFRSVVAGLADEVEELRETAPGSDHEAEELRDVLTLALHAIVARGGSLPREVGLAERKLRARLDAMVDGLSWAQAKEAERAGRLSEPFQLCVEWEGDEYQSWTSFSIAGPHSEAYFGVPEGMDQRMFEGRLLTAVDVLNGHALTDQAMVSKVLAGVEASVAAHQDNCWELWGIEDEKRCIMVNDLADALGVGPQVNSGQWPKLVAEAKRLAAGEAAYAVALVSDQTIAYLTEHDTETTIHARAKLFGTRREAESARVDYLTRKRIDEEDGWIEEVEDPGEFRAREDTW